MTSIAEESAVQALWHRRSRGGDLSLFDRYLANEFATQDGHRARVSTALCRMFQFAAEKVPFYRKRFRAAGIEIANNDGLAVLSTLDVLSKLDVQDNAAELRAEQLPPGESFTEARSSSGTTGRPTVVQRCKATDAALVYQKQREYRWFRFDPGRRLAYIRFAHHFAPNATGALPKDGEAVTFDEWPHIGKHFETGSYVTFNITSTITQQLEFLRRLRPDYLMSLAESLEHLALAAGGARPCDGMKGLISISEQLTQGMRRKIEASFAAPVRQNYGLNEIGLVALECEAGRLHVHTEHCWVEIVDEAGRAVRPDETGRILVTTLNNVAMPLFRYDTGDLATAARGDCPCGRTLPSFANIIGRYSRIAFLPDGTLAVAGLLREAIETAPPSVLDGVVLFQIHQRRDRNFELRVVSERPLAAAFFQRIESAWHSTPITRGIGIRVARVESLQRSRGGKFQVFTSDFMPQPDSVA
ncbi:MAG: phenylacetate--CoA ligase family protein [Rhizomicrobium sp.]